MSKTIPLSQPCFNGFEWRNVKRCLDTGWVSSTGKYVEQFEEDICKFTKAKYAVALSSGTTALQIALQIVGVEPGDEVIVPTVTFIAPVNAVRYVRAEPVFMDCDRYYNIDVDKTIEFILNETKFQKGFTFNKKTNRRIRAIIPVHVYGNAVDLFELNKVCRERNIKVIEDAAESLGTFYKNGKLKERYTGTIGDIGCFSFNGNKIITTGGGGMLVTKKNQYAKEARYLTTQAKDDPIRYIHNNVGYNYRLNNIQAAIGVAQLKSLLQIIKTKKRNYKIYREQIGKIDGLDLGPVPSYASNNYWMYALQIDEKVYGENAEGILKRFIQNGVEVRPMWYLNHLQRPYRHCQAYKIDRAGKMLKTTLNIPCSRNLKKQEIAKVVGFLKKWRG